MPTRRDLMLASGAVLTGAALGPLRAQATRAERDSKLAELTGGAAVSDEGITLDIPGLAENGLSVATTVEVESPMTEAEHVRAIHILSEQNPIQRLFTARLGPRAGLAKVSTNIRLAASQEVMALAEMSDGSFRAARKSVVVTIAACIDGG